MTSSDALTPPACPCCGGVVVRTFFRITGAPVHSVLLFDSREEAVQYPRGDVTLVFCMTCGFIWNIAYTGEHIEYSDRYEETQGYSAAFQEFHRGLALRLIERFALRGKTVLEIGCGKRGEFLHLLCDLGGNRGMGFDPVYSPERDTQADRQNTEFFRELYSEAHRSIRADLVCCKMTLEHVADPYGFLRMVRAAIGGDGGTVVFFQVPEMRGILERRAFWDVYYEHCSYFSSSSLSHVFERAGFRVLETWNEYEDQLLMIAAVPATTTETRERTPEVEQLDRLVKVFASEVGATLERWRRTIADWSSAARRTVIWGAGSKGVAFLTKTALEGAIEYAVDINPQKRGTFMAGTGQEIVAPEDLREYRPDAVIVMNPYYIPEITRALESLGIAAAIYSIEQPDAPASIVQGGVR